jgi:hypothetical protein
VFGGKLLEDDRTLSDYQIVPGSIIQLTVRPRGGEREDGVESDGDDELIATMHFNTPNLEDPPLDPLPVESASDVNLFHQEIAKDQPLTLAQKDWMDIHIPAIGKWPENALVMTHFLGTPARAVPHQQATETERRLVLHFYASQGHRIPRPPQSLSALAGEVAKQVTSSMGWPFND